VKVLLTRTSLLFLAAAVTAWLLSTMTFIPPRF
jgi:hypothetical protein